jgi:hypothetical protein
MRQYAQGECLNLNKNQDQLFLITNDSFYAANSVALSQ